MTRYEKGFLTKCAEYGVGHERAVSLMKSAGFLSALKQRLAMARLNYLQRKAYTKPDIHRVGLSDALDYRSVGQSLQKNNLVDENWNFTPAATNAVNSMAGTLAGGWQGLPSRGVGGDAWAQAAASTNLWPVLDAGRDAAQYFHGRPGD